MKPLSAKLPTMTMPTPSVGVKRTPSPLQALAHHSSPLTGGISRARVGKSYSLNPAGLEKGMRQQLMPIKLAGGGPVRQHHAIATQGLGREYAAGGPVMGGPALPQQTAKTPDMSQLQQMLLSGPLGKLISDALQQQRTPHALPQTPMPQQQPDGGGGGDPHSLYNMYSQGRNMSMPPSQGGGGLNDAMKLMQMGQQQPVKMAGGGYATPAHAGATHRQSSGQYDERWSPPGTHDFRQSHMLRDMLLDPQNLFMTKKLFAPSMAMMYAGDAGAADEMGDLQRSDLPRMFPQGGR